MAVGPFGTPKGRVLFGSNGKRGSGKKPKGKRLPELMPAKMPWGGGAQQREQKIGEQAFSGRTRLVGCGGQLN